MLCFVLCGKFPSILMSGSGQNVGYSAGGITQLYYAWQP
jgi:hypothetical protein